MNKLGLEVYLSTLFMLLLGSCTHGRVTEFHPHEEFPGRSQTQVYDHYVRLGFVNATGGKYAYKAEIFLQADSTFTFKGSVFDDEKKGRKVTLSEDLSTGRWFLRGDLLKLDFMCETGGVNRMDTYLVKGRRLIRTTFDGERVLFRAAVDLINK